MLQIDLVQGMMDCLYAECKPCITDCVLAELEKLGQKYRVALKVAKASLPIFLSIHWQSRLGFLKTRSFHCMTLSPALGYSVIGGLRLSFQLNQIHKISLLQLSITSSLQSLLGRLSHLCEDSELCMLIHETEQKLHQLSQSL